MKVAVLDHTATLGGAELALARTLEALPATAPELSVVLFAEGPLAARLRRAGLRVGVLPLREEVSETTRHEAGGAIAALRGGLAVTPFALRLARLLRAEGVDVVYTTSLKSDLIGLVAARLAGAKLVWHIHDRISEDYLPAPVARMLRRLARRAPDLVIANSYATAATISGAQRLRVIHPGLTPEQIGPAPRAGDSTRTTAPVVGLVGRISPTKGQLELVRAAPAILEAHPTTRFRLIGEPMFGAQAYADEVIAEAQRLGVADRIEVTGFIEAITAEMASLTVCVHASPTPEPFGQVVAEAMAQGTPVVATKAGGVPEIFDDPEADGPLGWLVEPGDVHGLAEAVVDALSNPAEGSERAVRAWESVTRRFPISETARLLNEAWWETVNVSLSERGGG
ncbi:glycosyltransferase family 4 protein [Kribbia dieselivorans]|uniref:glycosyltransferase family 4 protein n=1 Tax=Kribbia dieselivorans TaxID=331526 RepID=UPI0008396245|nr:glycosyltransferase family 4 protein [Kribbia dieselivorans]